MISSRKFAGYFCVLISLVVVNCEVNTMSYFDSYHLSRAHINKCKCQWDQILEDNECVNSTVNRVLVWDSEEQRDFIVDISEFAAVTVKGLNCRTGYSKIKLNFTQFLIYTNGLLDNLVLIDEPPSASYCIEHIATPDEVTLVAEVCEVNPKIPICCPPRHILTESGECSSKLTLDFNPILLGGFEWEDYDLIEQKTVCTEGQMLQTAPILLPTDVGASLIGYPLGAGLQWNSIYRNQPEFKRSEEYCVSVHENKYGTFYYAQFCILDPITEHEVECQNSTCVRKCCPDGFVYLSSKNYSGCVLHDNYTSEYNFFVEDEKEKDDTDNLKIIYGLPICKDFYPLDWKADDKKNITINSEGSLIFSSGTEFPSTSYCVGGFVDGSVNEESVTDNIAVCFGDIQVMCRWRWIVGSFLLSVSCIFFVLTLIVYLCIEELRTKMVGKCLVSQVSALLVAYLTLIILQNVDSDSSLLCKFPGTVEHFAALASFFWLNIMCFDLWTTLRSVRPADDALQNTTKRFAFYCLYGWGVPLIIALIRLGLDHIPDEAAPWIIRSNLGKTHCFFSSQYSTAKWIYLYGPILIILLVNVGLFIHVAVLLAKAHKEATKLLQGPDSGKTGKNLNVKKERAVMYLKLFLLMGISWLLEIIMWVSVPESDCYFWGFDIVNMFQGIFIFIIFVCKRTTLLKVKERFCCCFKAAKANTEYQLTTVN